MRRKDRDITDRTVRDQMIQNSHYMVLSMVDGDKPYAVPLNFGYEAGYFYFHSAREGRKIDILQRAGGRMPVSGTLVSHAELVLKGDVACQLTTRYSCVMFSGIAEEVTDAEERRAGMRAIVKHHRHEHLPMPESGLQAVCIIRITVDTLSAKQNNAAI